jgi:hypothetical protein
MSALKRLAIGFPLPPRDSDGVLLVGPSRWYHPILISQFALHRFCV